MSDNRERCSTEGGQETLKPNVKPQYDNCKQTPRNPDKHNRPPRRSRSSDGERRSRRREREREHGERRQRGRSEERHSHGRPPFQPPEDNLDETECPVCFCSYDNVFKTPKLLACGHTFCLECLARINVTSAEIKLLSCPVCREVTEIRHGRDLPQLGNNQDIFRKLPPQMQRAQSVRFERSKGKLVLKKSSPGSSKKSTTLPVFHKQKREGHLDHNVPVRAMEEGLAPVTIIDVGRPPNRATGRFRRLFRSYGCYYAVVIFIIVVAVSLLVVGILTFVVLPNLAALTDKPSHVTSPPRGTESHPHNSDG
ncbi:E3 ubiquitin-protein ligase RNF183 [Electrophorus electricus]|uniref:RING-type domain-containing protein n=1 Tax=Electrophorus electricus TaxID=8005 RepID=A0A4W4GZE9_ELEEL|nr:E3 ubiquitin-protein ligase RNF183 [Electrophorus electricus]